MQLESNSRNHLLTLSLQEAFQMQAALQTAIQRMTQTTTEVALRGGKVSHHLVGESAGGLVVEKDGKFYPSSLTIAIEVGER